MLREKLDIKILILYILALLPDCISAEALYDIAAEAGVGYFDYSECLSELIDTEHVSETEDGLCITDKGRRNGSTLESSLPYTVRANVRRRAEPVAAVMRRSAAITASHATDESGCAVSLALSDGVGEVFSLRLLCADEEQAVRMEKTFKRDAEGVCNKIIQLLSGE